MTSIIKKTSLLLCLSAGLASAALALDPGFGAKMNSAERPAADKVRDAARRPAEVLSLLGIESGMTVVDVAAGGGWYTEVLSAAVGPKGKVISQIGPRALQNGGTRADEARARAARLGNVEASFENMAEQPAGIADAALTAMNLHDAVNFRGEEGGMAFLRDIYNVLKPGGKAAIIDHEGSAGMDNATLHRLDPALTKRLIEQAGFEIVTESDVLNNPADDHSLGSHDDALERNTDRFLFIVRRPA
ncbi:MAG: class I SAM-dependent methyltransferase [Pseudomonadales bacterium]|nr:class I SAM-dependent methyltransferase [Pseudomonadales bacterium]